MKKTSLIASTFIVAIALTAGTASAQVAGSTTTLGVSVSENTQVARGWSVKKTLMGKSVYNDTGEKVGSVEDLIVAPNKSVSYLIVGAGGFIGIGRHDVAVPVSQIQDRGGKLVMAGATKDIIKAMPQFDYADRRELVVTTAEKDINGAKAKVAELEKRVTTANSENKPRLQLQLTGLQRDIKTAEESLSAVKRATNDRWEDFESNLTQATMRLRQSVDAVG